MRKLFLLCLLGLALTSQAAPKGAAIRLNQVGMAPSQEKVVVFDGVDPQKSITVKKLMPNGKWKKVDGTWSVTRSASSPWSGKTRFVVDLSALNECGDYMVSAKGLSERFTVAEQPVHKIAEAALKAFYLIRSGMPIEERYAGKWHRTAGHPDTQVIVHPSAASEGRPAGTVISSPKGWYDAGDYNKYVVNSAFSIGLVLCCYEENTDYFDKLNTNIPESGNQTPDVLDEMMYNLEWLLTMQDPTDGGVYHKLTTPFFEGFIMPDACVQKRYVVQKSVTACLDFAAVMAQAARLFLGNTEYADFSTKAIDAAIKAYKWAQKNPDVLYRQNEMNKTFKPEITTGEYGDSQTADECFWAATELYLATGQDSYLKDAEKNMPAQFVTPAWADVAALGLYEWVARNDGNRLTQSARNLLSQYVEKITASVPTSCFQSVYGNEESNFYWGCLAECCCQAVSMLYADKYLTAGKYRKPALMNADYLLGRNPLGYCYVTGFGSKSPMHPHHRISQADGIDEPFPGLLVGGPNPGQQDKGDNVFTYPSNWPDESYADHAASYASNEIALNWNASLVAMLCWLDAIR